MDIVRALRLHFVLSLCAGLFLFSSEVRAQACVESRSVAMATCEAADDGNADQSVVCQDNSGNHPTCPSSVGYVTGYMVSNSSGNPIPGTAFYYAYIVADNNCAALNEDPETAPGPRLRAPGYASSRCVGGCVLQDGNALDAFTGSDGHGNPISWTRVEQAYTGAACPSPEFPEETDPDPPPNPDGSRCDSAGGGYSQCVMDDGQHCINTPAGKSFCWTQSQTGSQTDAPQTAVRTQAPSQPVPPGATEGNAVQLGNSTTVTVNGVTYITNIYNTVNDNTNDDNEGVEDEDGDSANSSGDCAVQPACSGGDAIGCAILRQQWRTTCAFAGDGTEPKGFGNGQTVLPMDPDGLVREESMDGWFDDLQGGWAGQGTCPIEFGFALQGHQFDMDGAHLCYVLSALAGLVLLMGHISAGYILATGFRKGG